MGMYIKEKILPPVALENDYVYYWIGFTGPECDDPPREGQVIEVEMYMPNSVSEGWKYRVLYDVTNNLTHSIYEKSKIRRKGEK